jgi:acyl-CoA synthetase (AMP-forming)/AMP-acid ligase II
MNPTLLSSIVDHAAESDPARPFLQWDQAVWTAQDAQLGVLRLTHFLHALGVGPGDRIAVLSQNRPEVLLLLFAAARIGAILVPINTRYSAFEIATVLDDAQPSLLFCDTTTLSLASSARSKLRPTTHLLGRADPSKPTASGADPLHPGGNGITASDRSGPHALHQRDHRLSSGSPSFALQPADQRAPDSDDTPACTGHVSAPRYPSLPCCHRPRGSHPIGQWAYPDHP